MSVKVGYQGVEGSNSEKAASKILSNLKISDYELVPLISSKNVVAAIKANEIDFGLMAYKNNYGGTVEETYQATRNEHLELIKTTILPIKHSAFSIKEVDNLSITKVLSHQQALIQCKANIESMFPNAELVEIEDTAIGAERLAAGNYDNQTIVLCSKDAGEKHSLHLQVANITDHKDNCTEFRLLKLRKIAQSNVSSFLDKILFNVINDQGIGLLTKGLIIATIFISFFIRDQMGWSPVDSAINIGGPATAVFLFLTSNKLRNWLQYRSLKGYWIYHIFPNEGSEDINQRFEIPRVVRIDTLSNQLRFQGWICDKGENKFFNSTRVLMSPLGTRDGNLVYWYSEAQESIRKYGLNGIVSLVWDIDSSKSKITKLSGSYMGTNGKGHGNLEYFKITEEEFNALKSNDYL